jgi:hypothetical protein
MTNLSSIDSRTVGKSEVGVKPSHYDHPALKNSAANGGNVSLSENGRP